MIVLLLLLLLLFVVVDKNVFSICFSAPEENYCQICKLSSISKVHIACALIDDVNKKINCKKIEAQKKEEDTRTLSR